MELNPSETRIVIDALRFRLAYLDHEQASLKDTEEDKIAEISQDMYYLEMLIQCLTDSYTKDIRQIKNESRNYLNQHRQSLEKQLRSMASDPNIRRELKNIRHGEGIA